MPDLSEILPEFARDRRVVMHDLFEKQAEMFDARVEEELERERTRVVQIMREAKDLPANPDLKAEQVPRNPDQAELQKQLELNQEVTLPPSLESRIKNAAGD